MAETPQEEPPKDPPPKRVAKDGGPIPVAVLNGTFHGKKGRSGPPKDNRNAVRHGLTSGKLPKGAEYIEIRMNSLRRKLEDAVLAERGEVTFLDAAHIQTAVKWERHGQLALRWLRVQGDKLKPTDQLTFSREIAKASTERDKALAALKLDRDSKDGVFESLYAPRILPAAEEEPEDKEEADRESA